MSLSRGATNFVGFLDQPLQASLLALMNVSDQVDISLRKVSSATSRYQEVLAPVIRVASSRNIELTGKHSFPMNYPALHTVFSICGAAEGFTKPTGDLGMVPLRQRKMLGPSVLGTLPIKSGKAAPGMPCEETHGGTKA